MSLPNDSPDTPLGDVSVRINAKLLAAVVVATLVVVVGSIMMRRYWIDRNASILVERADKRLAANDVSGAIKDLGHYLKLRPTDYDVMLKLADCLESAKASEKSIYLSLQLLGDFLLQHRDRVDVRKRLVLLLVELQSYGQVLDEQLPYLIEEAPTDPVLFGQILECFEATDARDAGADFCLRMIEKNPAGSANYLGLLRLVEQQRFPLLDPERVAAMFEPGEAAASPEATSQDDSSNSGSPDDASPDDDSTEGDSTEDDSSAGDSPAEPDPQTTPSQRVPNHDLIEAILAALLKNAQPEIDGLLAAGRFRLAHGKAAEAERLAAEALKLDPQSVEANLLAIEASLQSREMALVEGDRDRAAAAREQAVERATTLAAGADADWRVLQILAQLRVEENQIDDAEQCIRRAIAAVE
ncbi:MAG: hypothetical protein EHM42_06385, partial [Planctomycetaceae bacterium]